MTKIPFIFASKQITKEALQACSLLWLVGCPDLCEMLKKFKLHQTHLAGRWRQHGSPFWPECPECRCWASFPRRNGCHEGVKLTSSPPRWQVHFVCRKAELCSSAAAHCLLSSSQLTSWGEEQQKHFNSHRFYKSANILTHKTTVWTFTEVKFWIQNQGYM